MKVTEEQWKLLTKAAVSAMERAYCPYSNYPVGAAGLAADGRIVTGCNVENAAFGVTLCAECGMVSDLVNTGGGKLVAFACVNGLGEPASPCGRCRQLLFEHAAPGMLLAMPDGVMTIGEILPGGFGAADLAAVGVGGDDV